MDTEKTQDEIIDEVVDQVVENTTTDEEPVQLTVGDSLKIISNAVKAGHLTGAQARMLRLELGVLDSSFTKKKVTKDQRKAKRKAQKTARAVTHRNGYKGQKMGFGEKRA